ncbi:MAG: hypothetical protein ACYC2P_09540 [Paludibacteraceae bacterium]
MKKFVYTFFLIIGLSNAVNAQNTTASFGKQAWKNFHIGWDIDKTDDYRWRDFSIGTGFARNFEAVPKAYWYIGGDLNWSKYTLYPNGIYGMGANNAYLKTFSISVPAYLGYNLYKSPLRAFGVKVYTGPTVELITSAKLDGYPYGDYNPLQIGWTIGTGVKLFYLFGFNVSYRYYPIPVLTSGNLVRSSVNFTLGF